MTRTEFIKLIAVSAAAGCVSESESRKAVRLEMLISKKSPADRFMMLKRAGFDGLELNSSSYDREVIKAATVNSSLKIVSVEYTDGWSVPLNHPFSEMRKKAVAGVREAVLEAEELSAEFVNVIPGVRIKGESYKEGIDRSVDSLSRIVPLLEQNGVKLAVQNVKSGFAESFHQLLDIVKSLNSTRAGICFDFKGLGEKEKSEKLKAECHRIFSVHTAGFSENLHKWQILDGYGGDIAFLKGAL